MGAAKSAPDAKGADDDKDGHVGGNREASVHFICSLTPEQLGGHLKLEAKKNKLMVHGSKSSGLKNENENEKVNKILSEVQGDVSTFYNKLDVLQLLKTLPEDIRQGLARPAAASPAEKKRRSDAQSPEPGPTPRFQWISERLQTILRLTMLPAGVHADKIGAAILADDRRLQRDLVALGVECIQSVQERVSAADLGLEHADVLLQAVHLVDRSLSWVAKGDAEGGPAGDSGPNICERYACVADSMARLGDGPLQAGGVAAAVASAAHALVAASAACAEGQRDWHSMRIPVAPHARAAATVLTRLAGTGAFRGILLKSEDALSACLGVVEEGLRLHEAVSLAWGGPDACRGWAEGRVRAAGGKGGAEAGEGSGQPSSRVLGNRAQQARRAQEERQRARAQSAGPSGAGEGVAAMGQGAAGCDGGAEGGEGGGSGDEDHAHALPEWDALEAEACAATCLSLLCVLADDTEYAPVAEAMGAMGGVRGGAHATGSVSLARVFGPQPGAEGGHGEPPTPSPSRQKGKGRKRGGAAAAEAEGGVRAAARGTREARARVAAAVWGAAGVAMRRGAAGWSQSPPPPPGGGQVDLGALRASLLLSSLCAPLPSDVVASVACDVAASLCRAPLEFRRSVLGGLNGSCRWHRERAVVVRPETSAANRSWAALTDARMQAMGERAVGVEEKRAATLAMERAWLIAALLGAAGRGRLGMGLDGEGGFAEMVAEHVSGQVWDVSSQSDLPAIDAWVWNAWQVVAACQALVPTLMSREDLAGVASLAVAVAGRAGEAGAGASRALQLLRGMAEGATELGREEPCAPPGLPPLRVPLAITADPSLTNDTNEDMAVVTAKQASKGKSKRAGVEWTVLMAPPMVCMGEGDGVNAFEGGACECYFVGEEGEARAKEERARERGRGGAAEGGAGGGGKRGAKRDREKAEEGDVGVESVRVTRARGAAQEVAKEARERGGAVAKGGVGKGGKGAAGAGASAGGGGQGKSNAKGGKGKSAGAAAAKGAVAKGAVRGTGAGAQGSGAGAGVGGEGEGDAGAAYRPTRERKMVLRPGMVCMDAQGNLWLGGGLA